MKLILWILPSTQTLLHVCSTTINLIFFPFLFQTPEDCSSGTDCLPMIISWEGSADIQSGDVLIVGIDDKLLISSQKRNRSEDEMWVWDGALCNLGSNLIYYERLRLCAWAKGVMNLWDIKLIANFWKNILIWDFSENLRLAFELIRELK